MNKKRKSGIFVTIIAVCLIACCFYGFVSSKAAAKKTKPKYSITLDKPVYTLKKGETVKPKAALNKSAKKKGVEWKSSRPEIAFVTKKGKITAKEDGEAVITAKVKGTKVKASCTVKVGAQAEIEKVSEDTTVSEIINDPAFGDFGRLLFPVDQQVSGDMTLADISSSRIYTWYSNIRTDKTVEIVNDLKTRSENGERIFYRIYSEKEMDADPEKRDTGLFYFKGEPGAKYAIMNAGGGFVYVGAMHDSFPHALEVSKKGYHAFALIYRPDSAYEDLARAIMYVNDHAKELGIDAQGYSLWGGSAGARMAATLGNAKNGPANYGRPDIPQAAAVIMQYTGYTSVSANDAPTYACVGTRDGIADYRTMESRLNKLSSLGIPTEFHVYKGLGHGFGLGTGTVADGWIEDAVAFWQAQS